MAAPMMARFGGRVSAWLSVPYRLCSSAPRAAPPRPPLRTRLLLFLYRRFYDVENLVTWSAALKLWNLRRKNAYYGYTQQLYGDGVAAAYYILSLRGGVRFSGQSDWIRPNSRGRFSWDFMEFRDVPIEEVDASGTEINYRGLDNLAPLSSLRSLSLSHCPHVDDWFLARLHVFSQSLEELSVSGCPLVTERGLATLHHLQGLRRLSVSSLPRLSNPGLVRILLEEALPGCEITGAEYHEGLISEGAGAIEGAPTTTAQMTPV
ncbi:distal membrane-arm assembly complex protein 2 isoform X1 [Acipenser ruthenus]|uniref:distal membrane-arm assembly complex protein 2 isoform X1 n=1 Tax=Acipenser ruthenus TaxID=7906 RepID=UPI0027413E42|nr:distal membrane-arm assembly complex protein 2 isoform X1 [Acipenser ruthenus]